MTAHRASTAPSGAGAVSTRAPGWRQNAARFSTERRGDADFLGAQPPAVTSFAYFNPARLG
jgi:hypothetical protein